MVVFPTIEGYELHELAGHGGVGDVYRATQRSTGVTVAVKVLREVSDGSAAWRRCRRELAALLALSAHPHVVRLIEVTASGDHPVLVTEYAAGGSAADLMLARGCPLDVSEVLRLGHQAASALAEAHARGIVHRDVKPHNLLLDGAGDVKLCDFGIASIVRSAELRDPTANVSLRFASPEDLEADGEVGPPSDVYSLGATLLLLARGEHLELRDRLAPWAPPSAADTPELRLLDELVASCLQPDPAARPAAAELAERLAAAHGFRPTPPARDAEHTLPRPFPGYEPPAPPRPSPVASRPHRRRAWIAALCATVIGAAAVGGAAWIGNRPEPPGDNPDTIEVVGRPAGLVELTAVDWPAGPVGECLVQRPGSPTLGVGDCRDAHDLQRVAAGVLSDDGEQYDAARIDAAVDAACAREVARLAVRVPTDALAVAVTRPSQGGWAAGDRSFQCFVGLPQRRLEGAVAHASRSG